MKLYLLYYDTSHGEPEEWNTFYTPVEIFDTADKRKKRKAELRALNKGLSFHQEEVILNEELELD